MHPHPIHRSWTERLAMTAVFLANGIAFGAWAGNIPRLREAARLDDAGLGIVLLCVSLGAVAAMQLAGRYAAVVGTARVSWMAALLLATALPLPSVAPGYPALLASGALLGLGLGLLDVCMNAHAAWMERRWGAAIMSSFHAGWSVGQLAGAALAGLLVALSLLSALVIPAALVATLGLAALLLPEDKGRPTERVPFARPSRRIVILGLIIAFSFAIEGGTADWSGVYLRTVLDVPPGSTSLALAVFAAVMVVMRLRGDALVRHFGPPRVLVAGALLAAAGLLFALTFPALWTALIGFALVGAGVANIVPIVFSAAERPGPDGGGPTAVSMVATAGYGAVMGAPPLIGFASHELGLRTALLLLSAAALAMAALGRLVRPS
jgi:MFS family permease